MLQPTNALMHLFTTNKYGRPAGHGISSDSKFWDRNYNFFSMSNREFAKQQGLNKVHFHDCIKKGETPKATAVFGPGFVYDAIVQPKSPYYLDFKQKRPLFNGNDSFDFSTGIDSTINTVFDSLQNSKSLLCFAYKVNNYYKLTVINLSKLLSSCEKIEGGMRVIEQGKKSLIGTERFFDRRYQFIGSSEGEYNNDLSLVFISKWRKYKRIKIKFSSLALWSGRRQHNKDIKSLLGEFNAIFETTYAMVRNDRLYYKKDTFSEIEKGILRLTF